MLTFHAPVCPRSSNSLSFLAPFFLLFFAFSLGFSPRVSIIDLTGFLAFSESSNFFMVVGARILLLSSASLERRERSKSQKKDPHTKKSIRTGQQIQECVSIQFTTLEPPSGEKEAHQVMQRGGLSPKELQEVILEIESAIQ